MKRYYLEMLSKSDEGRKVEVHSSLTLGRGEGNDLIFKGEEAEIVSGRHALLAIKGHSLWLRDLDSTNGTYVGKVKVTERELLGGEIISLGPMGPALRVEISDQPARIHGGSETVMSPREEVGLLSRHHPGNRSRILEMSKKLRKGNSHHEAILGILNDPDRLARLLKGGVKPERVADWLGGAGRAFAKQRLHVIWMGWGLGTLSIVAMALLGYQNITYRVRLKHQGALLDQIEFMEQGLQGLAKAGGDKTADKSRMVHQILRAERQLIRIREKLRLPDRANTYRQPLGFDVHQVLDELGKKGFIAPESFILSVQSQIDYFCRPENRATVQRGFARKVRYQAIIEKELSRMKLPSGFLYIAMQESLLDPQALSGNDARGLWQFVPITAREYDLQVPEDWKKLPPSEDQRTNPSLSTRAAAQHLHLLYSEFGDAALAMAAYNAGASKMRRVLRQIEDPINDRDFWYLYRMGLLPEETNQYVPKIIAIILIDRNREKYGFRI